MSSVERPLECALEDEAALTECVWKMSVFIPDNFKASLIHLVIVDLLTALCGLTKLKNNCVSPFLQGAVRVM